VSSISPNVGLRRARWHPCAIGWTFNVSKEYPALKLFHISGSQSHTDTQCTFLAIGMLKSHSGCTGLKADQVCRATDEIKITSTIKPTLNINPKSLLRVNTQALDQKSPLLTVDDLKRPGVSRVHTLPPVYEERHETTQETATVPTPPASDDQSSVHESIYTDMSITVYEVLKLIITHALSISAKDITQDVTIRQLAGGKFSGTGSDL